VPGSHKSNFDRPGTAFNAGTIEDPEELPDGVVNVTPKAGDIVIMSEGVTHGALPWTPKDRMRMYLVLRYHPQYVGSDLPDEIRGRLSPETLELVSGAPHKTVKRIAMQDAVTLT
jgi:hypothetical protein